MTVLDCRGMRCPWPAVRLARHLRSIECGVVEVLADDPAAEAELRVVAETSGWVVAALAAHHFRVSRAD